MKLRRKDGKIVNGELKTLNIQDIDSIMRLQREVCDEIENKEIFVASDRESYTYFIKSEASVLGIITEDGLIAVGVYYNQGDNEHNYGYDLEFKHEDILKTGQIESTIVKSDYRGNGLQRFILEELEKEAIKKGDKYLTATASPLNSFSVNTFLKLGYEIRKDKLKYGGLRRYVLLKVINH